MYGKDDTVPRIGDISYRVGYGLASGQASFWNVFTQ